MPTVRGKIWFKVFLNQNAIEIDIEDTLGEDDWFKSEWIKNSRIINLRARLQNELEQHND